MAAMLSDQQHKKGTPCNTGRWEVRKYTGEFQN